MQGYSNTRRWSSEARASVEDSSSSSSSQLAAAVPSSSSSPGSGSRENSSATTNEDGESVGAGDLQLLVGEDAALFDPSNQKTSSWLLFTLILGVSLTALYVLWIDPNTGYGGAFIDAVSSVSSSHEVNSIPSSLLQCGIKLSCRQLSKRFGVGECELLSFNFLHWIEGAVVLPKLDTSQVSSFSICILAPI